MTPIACRSSIWIIIAWFHIENVVLTWHVLIVAARAIFSVKASSCIVIVRFENAVYVCAFTNFDGFLTQLFEQNCVALFLIFVRVLKTYRVKWWIFGVLVTDYPFDIICDVFIVIARKHTKPMKIYISVRNKNNCLKICWAQIKVVFEFIFSKPFPLYWFSHRSFILRREKLCIIWNEFLCESYLIGIFKFLAAIYYWRSWCSCRIHIIKYLRYLIINWNLQKWYVLASLIKQTI